RVDVGGQLDRGRDRHAGEEDDVFAALAEEPGAFLAGAPERDLVLGVLGQEQGDRRPPGAVAQHGKLDRHGTARPTRKGTAPESLWTGRGRDGNRAEFPKSAGRRGRSKSRGVAPAPRVSTTSRESRTASGRLNGMRPTASPPGRVVDRREDWQWPRNSDFTLPRTTPTAWACAPRRCGCSSATCCRSSPWPSGTIICGCKIFWRTRCGLPRTCTTFCRRSARTGLRPEPRPTRGRAWAYSLSPSLSKSGLPRNCVRSTCPRS